MMAKLGDSIEKCESLLQFPITSVFFNIEQRIYGVMVDQAFETSYEYKIAWIDTWEFVGQSFGKSWMMILLLKKWHILKLSVGMVRYDYRW